MLTLLLLAFFCVLCDEHHLYLLVRLQVLTLRLCRFVTWVLGLVGDDAADEVRLRAAEVSHQLVQILLCEEQEQTQSQNQVKSLRLSQIVKVLAALIIHPGSTPF